MKPGEDVTETLHKDLRPLSPHWAFVVRFRVGANLEGGRMSGQVEHCERKSSRCLSSHFCHLRSRFMQRKAVKLFLIKGIKISSEQ